MPESYVTVWKGLTCASGSWCTGVPLCSTTSALLLPPCVFECDTLATKRIIENFWAALRILARFTSRPERLRNLSRESKRSCELVRLVAPARFWQGARQRARNIWLPAVRRLVFLRGISRARVAANGGGPAWPPESPYQEIRHPEARSRHRRVLQGGRQRLAGADERSAAPVDRGGLVPISN
jgi:hypothetical protein